LLFDRLVRLAATDETTDETTDKRSARRAETDRRQRGHLVTRRDPTGPQADYPGYAAQRGAR